MKTIQQDEAVSPVIGVILMVAIVVILAAVIAAFVFGMAGSTTTAKNVGVIVTQKTTSTGLTYGEITWQGGQDLNKVASWAAKDSTGASLASGSAPAVGEVNPTSSTILNKRVIITATFNDGAQQVIYDRQF